MVGGRDFSNTQLNRATDAYRQTGSAIKPFVYTAAIDTRQFTPSSIVRDEPITFPNLQGVWAPQNYDLKFRGDISIRYALENSINIVAVKVADKLGAPLVAEYARRMGLKDIVTSGEINDINLASLALGGLTKGVTPLELVSAYTPFANKGIYSEPIAVLEVKDSFGNIIFQDHPHQQVVIPESTAYVMTDMLRGVIVRGSGTITQMDRPACGKTGTTSDYTNAWFVGYTPDLAAVVWIGNDQQKDPIRIGDNVYGSLKSAELWGIFMKKALSQTKPSDFEVPDTGVVTGVEVCAQSGELATPNCPETRFETFLSGTEPTQSCHLHGNGADNKGGNTGNTNNQGNLFNPKPTYPSNSPYPVPNSPKPPLANVTAKKQVTVRICTESGLLAGPFCPPNEVVTETFTAGEEPTTYCDIHKKPAH
jgi:penicillin-binding protein 1A